MVKMCEAGRNKRYWEYPWGGEVWILIPQVTLTSLGASSPLFPNPPPPPHRHSLLQFSIPYIASQRGYSTVQYKKSLVFLLSSYLGPTHSPSLPTSADPQTVSSLPSLSCSFFPLYYRYMFACIRWQGEGEAMVDPIRRHQKPLYLVLNYNFILLFLII